MDLNNLFKTRQFLEEISLSVQSIVRKKFPVLTGGDCEDIDQEVKLKIWKTVSHGKKIGNLKSYLWRVVYTTALDIMKAKQKALGCEDEGLPFDLALARTWDLGRVPIGVETEELKMFLGKVIEALPPKRRTVLKLHLTGMDLEEMADFLNWTPHKVRHLYYRGLKDLKDGLEMGERPARRFFMKEGTDEKFAKDAMS